MSVFKVLEGLHLLKVCRAYFTTRPLCSILLFSYKSKTIKTRLLCKLYDKMAVFPFLINGLYNVSTMGVDDIM